MFSPGYPADYPNNINYTWTLVSGSNNTIVNFTIVDLQAESDSKLSCFDYLTVSIHHPLSVGSILHVDNVFDNDVLYLYYISSVRLWLISIFVIYSGSELAFESNSLIYTFIMHILLCT